MDSKYTVEVARLAVQCSLVVLRESENGVQRVTFVPKERIDVTEYLKYQRRFRHIKDDEEAIGQFRSYVDEEATSHGLCGTNP